jgi:hypothetical protein
MPSSSRTPDLEKGQMTDKGADVALQLITQHEGVEYSALEATNVRWKIDMHLMPIVSTL